MSSCFPRRVTSCCQISPWLSTHKGWISGLFLSTSRKKGYIYIIVLYLNKRFLDHKCHLQRRTGAAHHIQDGVQHHLQVDPGGPVVVLDRSGHWVELIFPGQLQVVQNCLVAAVAQLRESICSGEEKQHMEGSFPGVKLPEPVVTFWSPAKWYCKRTLADVASSSLIWNRWPRKPVSKRPLGPALVPLLAHLMRAK